MALKLLSVAISFSVIVSCNSKQNVAEGDWIKGSEEEKIKTIEKQFRGLDNAMVETGYRYQELYWAGQDKNWEYAKYQLDKIKLTIEHALQRRPLRAKSAEDFLTRGFATMKQSIESQDTALFNKEFLNFTLSCNNCHKMEKVPFFNVTVPTQRISLISK